MERQLHLLEKVFEFTDISQGTAFALPPYLAESIGRRTSILLDTSIWIRLSDQKTGQSKRVVERLRELVAREQLFCPLNASAIWELRKQRGSSLSRSTSLMEHLSLNVTLRGEDELFENEVINLLDYLVTGVFHPLSTNQIYGPLFSYLGRGYQLNLDRLPESTDRAKFAEHCVTALNNYSLSRLVSSYREKTRPEPLSKLKYQATNRLRRIEANGSVDRMRRIEQEYVASAKLIPILNRHRQKLPILSQMTVLKNIKSLPKGRRYQSTIESLLRFLPAMSASVEVLTVSGIDDNRKDSMNDFYDREFLAAGLSYPNLFVAQDKWVAQLVEVSRTSGYIPSLAFANSLDSLELYLSNIGN